ncbi:hypothetical protein BGZ60DRAFT_548191 [Tricladium varicosporioides]|nr:hypothetical protein BGZ60DRAFT_548191 [Hymenoscyphus varicosporioides]
MDNDRWIEVKPSSTHGIGVFARQAIPQGTYVLRETPLLAIASKHALSREAEFTLLNNSDKEIFLSLFGSCRCEYDPCVCSPVMKVSWSNQFSLCPDDSNIIKYCIYTIASRFNHSCEPNVWYDFDFEGNIVHMAAVRDIKEGEELFITYIGHKDIESTAVRRAELKKWGIDCMCTACVAGIQFNNNTEWIKSCDSLGGRLRAELAHACSDEEKVDSTGSDQLRSHSEKSTEVWADRMWDDWEMRMNEFLELVKREAKKASVISHQTEKLENERALVMVLHANHINTNNDFNLSKKTILTHCLALGDCLKNRAKTAFKKIKSGQMDLADM